MKLIAIIVLAVGVTSVAAQSPDERAAARELVKRKGDAVVMVLATLKIRANIGGEEQTTDQQAQANGTVLDASGLTVLSLSTLQPDDMMARSLSSRMRPGTKVDVSSEPSGIRMHLSDGREIPMKLVLRDQDLDLAFIKPSTPPSAPVTFVDTASARASLLDLLFVIQRTSEANAWATAASFGIVQLVVDKPRLYYVVAAPTTGGSVLGSPVFDPSGKFIGIVVNRSSGGRGPAVTGVLPADDIREIARQAQ